MPPPAQKIKLSSRPRAHFRCASRTVGTTLAQRLDLPVDARQRASRVQRILRRITGTPGPRLLAWVPLQIVCEMNKNAATSRVAGDAPTDYTGRFVALSHAVTEDTAVAVGTLSRDQEYVRMLRTLLGNLDGMVYRRRRDQQGTMEFVSAGCERVTGYQPFELLHNTRIGFEAIVHAEDQLWVCEAIRAAVEAHTPFDLEYRILDVRGSLRWVWDRGVGVYDAGQAIAIEGLIHDVTERKQAFQALRDAERRYRGLFENAIEGIFRTSIDGEYLDANPALAAIYGYGSADELMHSVRNIGAQLYVDPTRRAEFMRIMREQHSVSDFESEIYRKNGDVIWISENARAIRDDAGNVLVYEGTVENITERKLYQARLEYQATHDTLTGLANRSLLADRLEQAVRTAASHGGRLAVVFVDLDHFKLINDTLGHHVGDELLQTMAQRLQVCARDYDTVARVGGDEFVLLLNSRGPTDPLAQHLERILALVAEPWMREQREFRVTASVGVALYPEDGGDPQTLLRHADSALYRAKDSGRNNFQFFTSELTTLMTQRLDMEGKLRRALERDQFELHYQPRIDLDTGRVVGAEALVRWRLPEEGLIQPSRFIPLAEETGLVVPLGTWVMRHACEQMRRWQTEGLPLASVSVNVSAQQFRQGDLVHTVAQALTATGLAPRHLELELTESMMMQDVPQLIQMLHELKRLGVRISIDDFGAGYSSLGYLKRFPVDHLKIDRSFVLDIATDPDDAAIVRSIIALGHALGLRVVAEGVETAEQLSFLKRNECDEVQGFHLGRPVPAAELGALIRGLIPVPR
jgi:diguanylate cyclase (GGDEF)-like protein/PAS domain S-box-containing protein